ncbi:unnamed protein product, partial [Timema podura]|nr:unnamed protein product [Timema podura]
CILFQHVDRKYVSMLTNSNYFVDYVEAVLLDERTSLNVPIVFNFLSVFFPKVASHVLNDQTCNLIENLVTSLSGIVNLVNIRTTANKLNGDLRALALVYSTEVALSPSAELLPTLNQLLIKTTTARKQMEESANTTSVDTSVEEAPSKKRKITMDKEEGENPKPEPVAGCSKDPEVLPSRDPGENKQISTNWLEVLEKTITDLKESVEKKD